MLLMRSSAWWWGSLGNQSHVRPIASLSYAVKVMSDKCLLNQHSLRLSCSDPGLLLFRCTHCSQPLGDGTFSVGEDGQPYHRACHKQRFHPRCSVCKDFIPPTQVGTAGT